MPTDNLIQWLSQGPLWLFAFSIGLIVSIDVAVVEFTRDYQSTRDWRRPFSLKSRMNQMALLHATFHSLSFFLYTIVIYTLQSLAYLQIKIFDFPDGVGVGLLTLLNFFIVCFIWWTYRSKIREDHSDRSDDSGAMERSDMKLFVDVVRAVAQKLRIGERTRGVAVAGSVAVDMLAISALLKLYLLPHGDRPPVSQLFGNTILDVFTFAAIIFAVVWVIVFLAQTAGAQIRNTWLVAVLRIAEPLAVFYIVAGTVRALMQFATGNFSADVHKFGLVADMTFSIVVVLSLGISSGLSWRSLFEIYARRSRDWESNNPVIDFNEVASNLKALAPLVFVGLALLSFVLICLGYAYSTDPGRNTHNHLIEATGYFSFFVLCLTVIFIYLPSRKLDKLETQGTLGMKAEGDEIPSMYWLTLLGVALGFVTFSVFNLLIFGRSLEVDSIILWSAYVLLTWLLFDLRCWRFFRAGGTEFGAGRANDANFSEFVSALGVASAVIALAATVIVTNLKP